MKKFAVACLGLFAAFYLLNPGAGLFEILPDNLPLIGNLDEAAAVALLLYCLNFFGFDLSSLFGRKDKIGRS